MADMLVKLYNIPHSYDIEENLFKSGIRILRQSGHSPNLTCIIILYWAEEG